MRSYKQTGRQSCALSDYHQGLIRQAIARAEAMLEMRRAGFDDVEIGKRFGVSHTAVYGALKRHERRMNGG